MKVTDRSQKTASVQVGSMWLGGIYWKRPCIWY